MAIANNPDICEVDRQVIIFVSFCSGFVHSSQDSAHTG
jgi:hypothetical protein